MSRRVADVFMFYLGRNHSSDALNFWMLLDETLAMVHNIEDPSELVNNAFVGNGLPSP